MTSASGCTDDSRIEFTKSFSGPAWTRYEVSTGRDNKANLKKLNAIVTFLYVLMVKKDCQLVEMPGIEPGAFHMQSERATTALHPLIENLATKKDIR